MKKIVKTFVAVLALILGLGIIPINTYAEENSEEPIGINIGIDTTSKMLQIASGSTYDETFGVNNGGNTEMRIEVYAAPYAYTYSNTEDEYKLGFANETNYTQLSRWITFKDNNGNYVEKATYTIEPKSSLKVSFRISTPNSIPGGGQYAVVFAKTISNAASSGGIRTEASTGMVIFARSTEGESIIDAEVFELGVDEREGNIIASAKIKNTGNVDFTAIGNLKVEPIIGFSSYETPATGGRLTVIPEAELVIVDEWKDAPFFGIYKAIWTVNAGEKTETFEKIIVRIPLFIIIILITVLTIIIISVIMGIRKRKERRSRFSA